MLGRWKEGVEGVNESTLLIDLGIVRRWSMVLDTIALGRDDG